MFYVLLAGLISVHVLPKELNGATGTAVNSVNGGGGGLTSSESRTALPPEQRVSTEAFDAMYGKCVVVLPPGNRYASSDVLRCVRNSSMPYPRDTGAAVH